jgi:hypothetical protein
MEALGMAEVDPSQTYKVVPRGNAVELIRDATSQGQRVQKVTVFSRTSSYLTVRGHALRDMNNKELCSAQIQDVQNVGGVIVPRKVVLVYPAESIQLKMVLFADAREVTLNRQFDRDQAVGLFSRPVLPGVQSFDLARRGLDTAPGQVNPAGGFVPR